MVSDNVSFRSCAVSYWVCCASESERLQQRFDSVDLGRKRRYLGLERHDASFRVVLLPIAVFIDRLRGPEAPDESVRRLVIAY